MYQKILVPVDDSRASLAALHEACGLCKRLGSTLHVLHVLDINTLGRTGGTGEKAVKDVENVVKEFDITCETEIKENAGEKVADIICRSAKECGANLIVMGTHGFTGVMHLLMGSVAEGVLRQAEIPVMLLRRGKKNA